MNTIKKIWNFIWDIYHKYEEVWNYLISGALGVVVNLAAYELCRKLGAEIILSNVISWIIAVIFMYITNKFFVFKSKTENFKKFLKEFAAFVTARIFTLLVETLILYLGVYVLNINDLIIKIVAQIVVIILNYILSKLIIFKKKKA